MENKILNEIEEFCQLKYQEIIFDSDICDWKQFTSTFDKRIIYRNQLVFLIEDEDDNCFGAFINSRIESLCSFDNENKYWNGENISDPEAFIFSLKSPGRDIGFQKFEILPNEETRSTIFKQ